MGQVLAPNTRIVRAHHIQVLKFPWKTRWATVFRESICDWLLIRNKRALVCCFSKRKPAKELLRVSQTCDSIWRERDIVTRQKHIIVTSRIVSCSPAELFPAVRQYWRGGATPHHTGRARVEAIHCPELSLAAHLMMWDSSQLRVVFVANSRTKKARGWEMVQQMGILDIAFNVFF